MTSHRASMNTQKIEIRERILRSREIDDREINSFRRLKVSFMTAFEIEEEKFMTKNLHKFASNAID